MWDTIGTVALGVSIMAVWALGAFVAIGLLIVWAADVAMAVRRRFVGAQLIHDALEDFRVRYPDRFEKGVADD